MTRCEEHAILVQMLCERQAAFPRIVTQAQLWAALNWTVQRIRALRRQRAM